MWAWPNDYCELKANCVGWEKNIPYASSHERCCTGHCTGTGVYNGNVDVNNNNDNDSTDDNSDNDTSNNDNSFDDNSNNDGNTQECVSHAQLVGINAESSFWPSCDPSQARKGSATGYTFGHYCTQEWTNELNSVLSKLGYCDNLPIIRSFLAQIVYETGYFSTLGQPLDSGSGLIHMIPQNFLVNAMDMDVIFPGESLLAKYQSAADKQAFFRKPEFAWKAAAAWFKATNGVIPGCAKDLFPLSLDEQTRCILGRVVPRAEALQLVSRHV